MKTVSSDDEKSTHCFEIQTARTTYYVGEKKEVTMATLTVDGEESPTESGIGTEVSKMWEKKIRQALMPVTPQQSTTSVTSSSSPSKLIPSQLTTWAIFGVLFSAMIYLAFREPSAFLRYNNMLSIKPCSVDFVGLAAMGNLFLHIECIQCYGSNIKERKCMK